MTAWDERLGALPAVSLAQLESEAALLTRVDRKYIVSRDTWSEVMAGLQGLRALEIDGWRVFGYSSVYYDTPDLESYRAAARRRPLRYKVRTRRYLDSGAQAIEVKLRSPKGETVKHRRPLAAGAAGGGRLEGPARAFVASFPLVARSIDALEPILETRYERATLIARGARITVDRGVTGTRVDGVAVSFGDALIVETKSPRGAGDVDRALWARGIRPSRVSKYCTTMAALEPGLPSNRWSRTLRRHLPTAVSAA